MITNYQKHFGDLENASETLGEICRTCPASRAGEICDEACPLYVPGFICNGDPRAFTEWLKSEASPFVEACNAVMGEYPNTIRMLEES